MARPKKIGTYLNVCIEKKLEQFCDDAGQTKTVAVERALTEYLNNYEKQQEILKKLEDK